jgi:hypothetical protein
VALVFAMVFVVPVIGFFAVAFIEDLEFVATSMGIIVNRLCKVLVNCQFMEAVDIRTATKNKSKE